MKSIQLLTSVILALGLTTACQPPQTASTDTETQVSAGNASLKSMREIEKQLFELGVSITFPTYSEVSISYLSEPDATKATALLDEYIRHSQRVLSIAKRDDVTISNRDGIETGLTNAKNYRDLIAARLLKLKGMSPAAEANDADFAAKWRTCLALVQSEKVLYGISLTDYSSSQEKILATLLKEKLSTILYELRPRIECFKTLDQVERATNPNPTRIRSFIMQRVSAILLDSDLKRYESATGSAAVLE
ncbi:MAG: hypothetical protein JNJ49_02310 [Bdellovibrionaceae bacterium]|nr:hypothetical protein [Pseudobdellovibrionaceae bacterium]